MSAPLVDVETGEVLPLDAAVARKLDALATATTRVLAERPGGRKEAMRRYLLGLGADLTAERDRLGVVLGRQWDWLAAHPDDPRVDAREATWRLNLRAYETICAALDAAKGGLR